jgi:hypothetical protein
MQLCTCSHVDAPARQRWSGSAFVASAFWIHQSTQALGSRSLGSREVVHETTRTHAFDASASHAGSFGGAGAGGGFAGGSTPPHAARTTSADATELDAVRDILSPHLYH